MQHKRPCHPPSGFPFLGFCEIAHVTLPDLVRTPNRSQHDNAQRCLSLNCQDAAEYEQNHEYIELLEYAV